MSLPLNIIDLAITEDVSGDLVEVARRLDKAADLVEGFAEQSGLDALNSLLTMVEQSRVEQPGDDGSSKALAEKTRQIATEMTDQSSILHCEVERFISVSSEG